MASTAEQIPEIGEADVKEDGATNTIPAATDPTDTTEEECDLETGNSNVLDRIRTNVSTALTNFGERPECFKNTFQEVSFVFQATVATATTSFLSGISIIVTGAIGRDLGMTQSEISWITASTSLVAGAFQLGLGQLADLLGRKPMFLIGMGSFSAFSLIVAFAQNPFWMVIICGVLGIPSAMIVPPAIGIMGAAYRVPSKRKNLAFSAFSAGNPMGFVFGLIACGIASSIFNWRAAFIFCSILWALFTITAFWAVPTLETFDRGPWGERLGALKQFDYVGTVLTIFGTGMFTAALTLGPDAGWDTAEVLCLLIIGILLLVIFGFWERIYPTPLMPPHIWKDRNFSLIIVVVLTGMMAFTASGFWIAYYMQTIQKLPTLTVAVHLLPMAVGGLLWNVLAGHILHRVNNTLIMLFGSLSYLAAGLLFSFMKQDSIYWAFIFPALVLNVAGADLQFNVANMYVMQSLPSHQQSLAGGIFNVVIRLGNSAVMGISTAVFSSIEITPAGMADPMLKFTRTFQASMAFAAVSLLFTPFIKLGTQGNAPKETTTASSEKSGEATGLGSRNGSEREKTESTK